jgi:predicted enzyme related to lactoylglutathione lyase
MSTNEVRTNDAATNAALARPDMKLEVVVIPVSDVDRAKAFYERIGWRLNYAAYMVAEQSGKELPQ